MNSADIDRIKECLAYIQANPTARYPAGWIAGIESEARAAGLLPHITKPAGCACRPGIDHGIVYGGDMVDVF